MAKMDKLISMPKKKNLKKTIINLNKRTIILISIALLTILTIFLLSMGFYRETYSANIFVDGINIGGMTFLEAQSIISKNYQQRLNNLSIKLRYLDKIYEYDANDLNITTSTNSLLHNLKAIGRKGSFFNRIGEAMDIFNSPKYFNTNIVFDEKRLFSLLTSIKGQIDIPATDSYIHFDPNHNSNHYEDIFYFTPDIDGSIMELQSTYDNVVMALTQNITADIDIVTTNLPASITDEFLWTTTNKIGFYETKIGGSPERTHNVRLSLNQFNGLVVYSGETISFNKITGPRSQHNGYLQANIIGSDKTYVLDWGGGVCQTSTTLYAAILNAGLLSVERYHHSMPSSYIKLGFDATVNYGSLDFKFQNNTAGPIYLKTGVYQDTYGLYARIWVYGIEDGKNCELVSQVIETIKPGEDILRVDEKGEYVILKSEPLYEYRSPKDGKRIVAYRLWIEDGVEVRKEKIHTDYFKPIEGIYYMGIN